MSDISGLPPSLRLQRFVGSSGANLKLVVNKQKPRQMRVGNTEQVTPSDSEDVKAAGDSARAAFSKFLSEPEEIELFGFVLDGKTSDVREDADFTIMSRLVSFLQGNGGESDGTKQPQFIAAVLPKLPNDKDSRFIMSITDDNDPKVFISNDLGFRDVMIAAQDGYSDFAVHYAAELGLDLPPGDVGSKVSEMIKSGKPPRGGPTANVEPVTIIIDGEEHTGIQR